MTREFVTVGTTLTAAGRAGGEFEHRFVLGGRGLSAISVAKLATERATHADVLVLPAARDGARTHLAEKVLAWLEWATRHLPSIHARLNPRTRRTADDSREIEPRCG